MKASKFKAGDRVAHGFYGPGVVLKENRSTGRRGFFFIMLDLYSSSQMEIFEDHLFPVADPNDILKDLLC